MRTNETTFQKAINQARKLQPQVRQINNSLMFDCSSTSMLDVFHHVYLGPNKFNPFLDSKCDCGTKPWIACVHRAACFLQLLSNLEERLWKGCDFITGLQDQKLDSDEALKLWLELLDKYERANDLLKAIEQGWDISTLTGPFKDSLRLAQQVLLTA